jgi:hypothetical protein
MKFMKHIIKNILLSLLMGFVFLCTAYVRPIHAALNLDVNISATSTAGTPTTSTFSTSSPNELLVAFISSDIDGNLTSTTVSGAGLTWTRQLQNLASGRGLTEVWTAYATGQLSDVTVGFTYSGSPGWDDTLLNVISFTGADSSLGNTLTPTPGSGNSYATNDITTTRDNSWIWAVGEQWDTNSDPHTAGNNQEIVADWPDNYDDSHHWTQKQISTTPSSGTSVTINDTAPTGSHTWNWCLIEIMPTAVPTPTPTPEPPTPTPQATPTPSPNSKSFTLAGWINPTSSITHKAIIVKDSEIRLVSDYSNHLVCQFYDGSSWQSAAVSSTTLVTDKWQQVVCTYDQNTLSVFVNGNLSGTQTLNHIIVNESTNHWRFGSDESTTYGDFNGKIDEARIYNHALSPSEVQQLYNWAPGPVIYYKFDEGSGTSAYDSSGNNNTGNLLGNAQWRQGKFGNGVWIPGDNYNSSIGFTNPGITSAYTYEYWTKFDLDLEDNEWLSSYFQYDTSTHGVRLTHSTPTQFLVEHLYSGGEHFYQFSHKNIRDHQWHHFAFIYNGINTGYLYVDGKLESQGSLDPPDLLATGGLNYLFQYAYNDSATQDEFKLYNYARTSSQVVEDMNAGHPAPGSPVGSPTLYWKLDEGYGTTTHDFGNTGNYVGTLHDAAYWTRSGKYNSAIDFSGGYPYISAGDVGFVDGLTGMTVSMWVNPNTLTNSALMCKRDFSDQFSFCITTNYAATDEVYFQIGSSLTTMATFTTSNLNLSTSNWYYLTFVFDGSADVSSRMKVYKNGKPVSGSTDFTPPTSMTSGSTSTLYLGDNGTYSSFQAKYDDVKIYTFPLTEDQIKIEYNQGQSEVFGSVSTDSNGDATWENERQFCVPGDTSTCTSPNFQFSFDENTGNTIYQYKNSFNQSTATLYNTSWLSASECPSGSCLSFNGTNSKVDDVTEFWIGNTNTINFWAYPATTTEPPLSMNSDSLRIYFNAGVVSTYGFTSPVIYVNGIQTTSIEANKWQHITVTFDDVNIWAIVIGYSPGLGYYKGRIDEIRMYDYTRTPAQIAWDYNQGAPIAHYDFDECSGSILHDVAPKADINSIKYNGTINASTSGQLSVGNCSTNANTMWYNGRNGKYSSSLNFDGTDDYVDLGTSIDTSSFKGLTVSGWFKSNSGNANQQSIITKMDDHNYGGLITAFGIWTQQSIIYFEITTNPWVTITTPITDDVWNHFTATYDGNIMKLYINGVLKASDSQTGTMHNATSHMLIGAKYYDSIITRNFDGPIDNIKIWNYALTPEQIKTEYNQGSAVRFGP